MKAVRLFDMLRAELGVVFRRGSGMGALLVSLGMGLFAVLLMHLAQQNMGDVQLNDASVGDMVRYSGADCAGWALYGRNFFVLPLLLLLATGASVAGEIHDHSLREVLVRPVHRWQVLGVKLTALMTLSMTSLLMALLPSLLVGMLLFGTDGPLVGVLLGYAASMLTDLGIIAFGALAGVFVRSAGGVVVSVILLLMLDYGLRTLLWLRDLIVMTIQQSSGLEPTERVDLSGFLPGAALDFWQGWADGWVWSSLLGLLALIGVSLGATLWRFHRMDVP